MRRSVIPDLQDRQEASARAKQALLEKFRTQPGPDDPEVAARLAARAAIVQARNERIAAKETARLAREAELAEQRRREAELKAQLEREAAEAAAKAAAEEADRLLAEKASQKAARDARYAARKAAKKERRQKQRMYE